MVGFQEAELELETGKLRRELERLQDRHHVVIGKHDSSAQSIRNLEDDLSDAHSRYEVQLARLESEVAYWRSKVGQYYAWLSVQSSPHAADALSPACPSSPEGINRRLQRIGSRGLVLGSWSWCKL